MTDRPPAIPGLEDIQRQELARLFERIAVLRLGLSPLLGVLALIVALADEAVWRRAVLAVVALAMFGLSWFELARFRRQGLRDWTLPANLAAMLSSLQMGFKTLAIEKRSSEVWSLLGQVKTEFAKFGDVVEATKKSIDAAAKKFDEVGTRTRAIQRKLRDVQELPAPVAPTLLDAAESDDDTDPLTPDRMP